MESNYMLGDLTEDEVAFIENRLEEYDQKHITYQMKGNISIGIKDKGQLIAGLYACFTAYKIVYVSTVFVDEDYRKKGIGTLLMKELEKRARHLGANLIRLDTFNFQGREFYKRLGYDEVGFYQSEPDGFSESFFLKRLYHAKY